MPASWLQRPAVLMAAYAGLSLVAEPWFTTGGSFHQSAAQLGIVVVLAWLAICGSRAARVLLMAGSMAGIVMALFGSTSWWTLQMPWARIGYFACCAAQICLLVSTPMYQRTRPGRSREWIQNARFLPIPRWWMATGSAAAGLLITRVSLAAVDFRPLPCPAGVPAGQSCIANGSGYPIPYQFELNIAEGTPSANHWTNIPAPHGIQVIAFATDFCLWSLAVLLVVYLVCLNAVHRVHESRPGSAMAAGSPA